MCIYMRIYEHYVRVSAIRRVYLLMKYKRKTLPVVFKLITFINTKQMRSLQSESLFICVPQKIYLSDDNKLLTHTHINTRAHTVCKTSRQRGFDKRCWYSLQCGVALPPPLPIPKKRCPGYNT